MLQAVWPRVRVQDLMADLRFFPLDSFCKSLVADGDQTLVILQTNCVLIVAISLGLVVDMRDLYAPIDR